MAIVNVKEDTRKILMDARSYEHSSVDKVIRHYIDLAEKYQKLGLNQT